MTFAKEWTALKPIVRLELVGETGKRTFLYDYHLSLGAKMVPFGGFEMPVQYSGIIDEHTSVREAVGLFDLSHMGEFVISGRGASSFLQRVTTNNVATIQTDQAQYTAICNENGGIIDDCVLYRFSDHYLLVVNASNIEKDLGWLESNLQGEVSLKDRSDDFSLVAVQGPKSLELLSKVVNNTQDVRSLPFYWHCQSVVAGIEVICARTGYTGELGYEIYVDGGEAEPVWDILLEEGASLGVKPVGLGARDTLRLEMKYCLYGNDIDEKTNPIEAGLGWITKLEKGDFIGKAAIAKVQSNGPERKLIGFELLDRGIARHGYSAMFNGNTIGSVTSGTHSPTLGKSIGMAYVDSSHASTGSELKIDIRGKVMPAKVVKTPFWTKGTATEKV
ncbi:MAG TPA: glycine cleavage system aminomethyltransferase GcvT [Candidatus Marinimicrobia bacterium]|nr:glycine cleavage system aminomethyltransferase GcvT [Candidatus Neomarinimicrobiota bacterium]HIB03358.1 glycine cleavage system aminomethyltransferase GcvT [Candidatus Neomarinimicrobiota bacterium]HIB71991.1 glycine cleavage system aminomethyltransferase GcvT [Candidatus Neomarinimicrobiota bacterium]HIB95684.1 glycine cleavage system aminomethyltransferase GcvT [Candidatus Neomarinimicrobiota bacterium]HIN62207.1 glycine cleavage system aminomethyltransferase GcvT [Candidatus Neomarinimic